MNDSLRQYVETSRYECGKCGDNIFLLLGQMEADGVPIESSRVIYILPTERTGLRPAYKNRVPTEPESVPWHFHVVLEHNGIIIDPDLPLHLHGLSPEHYFQTMFNPEKVTTIWPFRANPLSKIKVRAIRAVDYLRNFAAIEEGEPRTFKLDAGWWAFESEAGHPSIPLSLYLRN